MVATTSLATAHQHNLTVLPIVAPISIGTDLPMQVAAMGLIQTADTDREATRSTLSHTVATETMAHPPATAKLATTTAHSSSHMAVEADSATRGVATVVATTAPSIMDWASADGSEKAAMIRAPKVSAH